MQAVPANHPGLKSAFLLDDLIDRLQSTAGALNDNCWQASQPLDSRVARLWVEQLNSAINSIENAAEAHDTSVALV